MRNLRSQISPTLSLKYPSTSSSQLPTARKYHRKAEKTPLTVLTITDVSTQLRSSLSTLRLTVVFSDALAPRVSP